MDSRQKIQQMLDHVEGPVPWLEIAIDEALVLQGLGKPVPPEALETILPIDVSWSDRVEIATRVGLDALGIYHWEAFGSTEDDTRPVLHRTPHILKRTDLSRLDIPNVTLEDVYPEVLRAKAAIGDTGLALFVEFATSLEFTLSDMGFENACLQIYDDPGFFGEVMERYAAYAAQLVSIYNRIPEIDFIWIGDDLAYKSGPFFSLDMYRRHVFPFIRKVVSQIEKPWMFHSDGDIAPLMEDIISWGPGAVHPIEGDTDRLLSFKQEYGQRIALIGNLSVDLLTRGSTSAVTHEAQRLIQNASVGGGYGFSSGNSLPRYANLENVFAVSRVVKEFNQGWM